jgi:hypothetical protein
VFYLYMWLLGSPDTGIASVHLATDVECGFIGEATDCAATQELPSSL